VTSLDHVPVLDFVTALGFDFVGDRLIIGPPFRTLDVLLRGAHLELETVRMLGVQTRVPSGLTLNKPVAGWTQEISTLRGDTVPIPLEHLGDHDWQRDSSERLVECRR
jgi:hypothetical protein